MKTKIIALLLALVVMLGVFASCTPPSGNTGDTGNQGNTGDTGNTDKPNPDDNTGDDKTTRPWKTTELIFEMTDNSNNAELGSTCRRYLAGDTTQLKGETAGTVDTKVTSRNAKAYEDANVTVKYVYMPDTSNYVWGQNIDRINQQVLNAGSSSPDIYCNFVYDMVAASLKSSFANLLSTTMYEDGHELAGAEHNYFTFEDQIDLEDDGKNYMTDYMRSLTLSKYKMYCLSSDYFTDMVRAFFVVPVNIELLESLEVSTAPNQYNSDRVNAETGALEGDGDFTIEDFYQLVWDKEWTYETLAAYSSAIYSNDNSANDDKDIGDTLGFALATSSGLSASGMLYTTSITIIDRKLDEKKGDFTYSYPGTVMSEVVNDKGEKEVIFDMAKGGQHKELENFCDAISSLFLGDGVIAIDNSAEQTGGYGADALTAIRNRFSTNNILFGGVICLGSLEYDEYKDMNADGKKGYGIAPVPLYRGEYTDETGNTKTDEYLTQVHNIGRVGAISYTTKKFAQCTAFLDYQSMNSNDVLNTYYDYKLAYDVVNSDVAGNVEMLQYIRYNVRSSFDKAYEDALGIYYSTSTDGDSMKQIWHYIIKDGGYTTDGAAMKTAYDSYAPVKAQRLYALEYSTFPGLPD